MHVLLDQKKHKRTLITMYLGIVGVAVFFCILTYQGVFSKQFPWWIFLIIIPFQLIPLVLIIRRLHLLKTKTDGVIVLESGYLTVWNKVLNPLVDLPIDAIEKVGKVQNNKGNLSFSLKLDTELLQYSGLKRLLMRNSRINELAINKADLEALHLELLSQCNKRNLSL